MSGLKPKCSNKYYIGICKTFHHTTPFEYRNGFLSIGTAPCLSLSLSVSRSLSRSVSCSLSLCLSVSLSVCLSVPLSLCLSFSRSARLPVSCSLPWSVVLSLRPFVPLSPWRPSGHRLPCCSCYVVLAGPHPS